MGILEGRVAIVTGASSGAGHGTARRFAEEGAIVVATARRKDRLDALVKDIEANGGQALAIACDIYNRDEIHNVVDTTIAKFGKVDILANIGQGGLDQQTYLMEVTEANALNAFEGGPMQTLWFMQRCFPHMKERNYGRIINCGSQSALMGLPGFTAYQMGKAAIQALTRTASQEWAQYGIVTNIVLPAHWSDAFSLSPQGMEAANAAAASSPMKRLGLPYEDVSPLITFLASEGAGYINGQTIGIDGANRLIA